MAAVANRPAAAVAMARPVSFLALSIDVSMVPIDEILMGYTGY
jgi:hypothetical protein